MLDVRYIAGFIDGDGCIYYQRVTSRNTTFSGTVCVRIGNESKSIVEGICKLYNGRLNSRVLPSGRSFYDASITGNRAFRMLTDIEPFLVSKKAQAQLVLENWEYLKPRRGGSIKGSVPGQSRISEEISTRRRAVWKELKRLKESYN